MLAAPSSVDNISYGIGNTLEMEVVSLEEFWRRGNSERETCIYHTSCLVNIQTSHAKFHRILHLDLWICINDTKSFCYLAFIKL